MPVSGSEEEDLCRDEFVVLGWFILTAVRVPWHLLIVFFSLHFVYSTYNYLGRANNLLLEAFSNGDHSLARKYQV